jgi:asparagine synthetase B (glutamine-hydrolysing)
MHKLEKLLLKECKKYEGIPVSLSGGIDSSLLAALIKPRFVVSVKLPKGKPYDENKYSKKVAKFLNLKRLVINPQRKNFEKYVIEATKAVGRPISHFNMFPLFCLYKKLNEMGEKELILGDGPDETMCGYARNIMMKYLYKDMFEEPAFEGYGQMLGRVLKPFEVAYAQAIDKDPKLVKRVFNEAARMKKSAIDCMCFIDMKICRKDMDDMSDGLAKHFGIKNIRPYQDNPEIDNFMFKLPLEDKIEGFYGKFLLRQIAAKYIPYDIAWRLRKVGGPVYPVNLIMGWTKRGEFDKTEWLKFQRRILHGRNGRNTV